MDRGAVEGRAEKGKLITCQDKLLESVSFPSHQSMLMPDHNFLCLADGHYRAKLSDIQHDVDKLRKISMVSVAVWFGVTTPEDAAREPKMADGVTDRSAIVKRIASH
jgi:hypothetical protein